MQNSGFTLKSLVHILPCEYKIINEGFIIYLNVNHRINEKIKFEATRK